MEASLVNLHSQITLNEKNRKHDEVDGKKAVFDGSQMLSIGSLNVHLQPTKLSLPESGIKGKYFPQRVGQYFEWRS